MEVVRPVAQPEKRKDKNFLQHLSKEVDRKEEQPEQLLRIKGLDAKLLKQHDKTPYRGKHCQDVQRLKQLGQAKKGGEGGKYTWGGDKETIRLGLEEMESGPGSIALDEHDPLAPDLVEDNPRG